MFLKFFLMVISLEFVVGQKDFLYISNARRALNVVDEKFISFSFDPAMILNGFESSSNISRMAKKLSPAFLRISGPSTSFITFGDKNSFTFTVTSSMWKSLNFWIRDADLTPVVALNDRNVLGVWDPKTILPLLEINEENNFNCYWQLGLDSRYKSIVRYKEDLVALKQAVEFSQNSNISKIVGSNIEPLLKSRNYDYVKKTLLYLQDVTDAIIWEDYTSKNLNVMASIPLWFVQERESHPVSSLSALKWATEMGNAAKNGFEVIFRQPRAEELTTVTPVYWMSLLFKTLMGRNVLELKYNSIPKSEINVYGHCAKRQDYPQRGALAVLVVNTGVQEHTSTLRMFTQNKNAQVLSYVVTFDDENTYLNGQRLFNLDEDFVPKISLLRINKGVNLVTPSQSAAFFILPAAKLPLCIRNEDPNPLPLVKVPKFFKKKQPQQLEIVFSERPTSHPQENVKTVELQLTEEEIKKILQERAKSKLNATDEEVDPILKSAAREAIRKTRVNFFNRRSKRDVRRGLRRFPRRDRESLEENRSVQDVFAKLAQEEEFDCPGARYLEEPLRFLMEPSEAGSFIEDNDSGEYRAANSVKARAKTPFENSKFIELGEWDSFDRKKSFSAEDVPTITKRYTVASNLELPSVKFKNEKTNLQNLNIPPLNTQHHLVEPNKKTFTPVDQSKITPKGEDINRHIHATKILYPKGSRRKFSMVPDEETFTLNTDNSFHSSEETLIPEKETMVKEEILVPNRDSPTPNKEILTVAEKSSVVNEDNRVADVKVAASNSQSSSSLQNRLLKDISEEVSNKEAIDKVFEREKPDLSESSINLFSMEEPQPITIGNLRLVNHPFEIAEGLVIDNVTVNFSEQKEDEKSKQDSLLQGLYNIWPEIYDSPQAMPKSNVEEEIIDGIAEEPLVYEEESAKWDLNDETSSQELQRKLDEYYCNPKNSLRFKRHTDKDIQLTGTKKPITKEHFKNQRRQLKATRKANKISVNVLQKTKLLQKKLRDAKFESEAKDFAEKLKNSQIKARDDKDNENMKKKLQRKMSSQKGRKFPIETRRKRSEGDLTDFKNSLRRKILSKNKIRDVNSINKRYQRVFPSKKLPAKKIKKMPSYSIETVDEEQFSGRKAPFVTSARFKRSLEVDPAENMIEDEPHLVKMKRLKETEVSSTVLTSTIETTIGEETPASFVDMIMKAVDQTVSNFMHLSDQISKSLSF